MKIIVHLNKNFHSLLGLLYTQIRAFIAYEDYYTLK